MLYTHNMVIRHRGFARRSLAAASMAATLGLVASGAAADPIGYTQGIGPGTAQLQRIDLATLEVAPIGDPGGVSAEFLAFHANGTLYGVAHLGGNTLRLVSFDLDTGVGSVVADFDTGFGFVLTGFAGDARGNLWASGAQFDAGGEVRLVIVAIDPAGGIAGAPVEVLDLDPFSGFFGLAACGDLLLSTAFETGLVAIDPVSGETSVLFPGAPHPADMDVGPDGALWIFSLLPIEGFFAMQLRRLDLTTGEVTFVGQRPDIVGLAIPAQTGGFCGGSAPLSIPTLSPLALVALAVTLAVAALWIARRRA